MYIQAALLLVFSGIVVVSADECASEVSKDLPKCTAERKEMDKEDAKSLEATCKKLEESANCIRELMERPQCKDTGSSFANTMKTTLEQSESQFQQMCSKTGEIKCSVEVAMNAAKCKPLVDKMTAEPEPEPKSKDEKEKKEDDDEKDATDEKCSQLKEVIECFKKAIEIDGCENSEIAESVKKDNVKRMQDQYSEKCSGVAIIASLFMLIASIFFSTAL